MIEEEKRLFVSFPRSSLRHWFKNLLINEGRARQPGPHNSIFFSSRFSGRKKRKIDLLAAYRGALAPWGPIHKHKLFSIDWFISLISLIPLLNQFKEEFCLFILFLLPSLIHFPALSLAVCLFLGGAIGAAAPITHPKTRQGELEAFIHSPLLHWMLVSLPFISRKGAPTPSISISLSINLPIRKRRLMREKRLIGEGRLMLHGPHLFLQVS